MRVWARSPFTWPPRAVLVQQTLSTKASCLWETFACHANFVLWILSSPGASPQTEGGEEKGKFAVRVGWRSCLLFGQQERDRQIKIHALNTSKFFQTCISFYLFLFFFLSFFSRDALQPYLEAIILLSLCVIIISNETSFFLLSKLRKTRKSFVLSTKKM